MPTDPPAAPAAATFRDLELNEALVRALTDVGYESPSPIQAATIPHMLAGADVVGQAQTGTGKTAAFALPILSRIDVQQRSPQALVLVPTRELAIQVAEAFQRYAAHLPGFHVVPIYGGQSYTPQLHSLRRGVHVVVGTPGRLMDHIKRETLQLATLRYVVLDEADEMLRMGFIDDVEWILEQAPQQRQIALFSATMPTEVRRIAQNHLRNPAEVTIKSKTGTAAKIRQRYWVVSGMHKLDALTRILEAEPFEGMLVFARTKLATEELAERLEARGFAVEALNGDIAQAQRERTVARLKSGQIDIVVATDVAARGLDVERVSHVINYDVPYDPEAYVHRIGRTGRAGRSGEAILFIAPRERNMLRVIERSTRQTIEQMELPSIQDVNDKRVARFNDRISAALAAGEGEAFRALIERFESEHNVPAVEIAAALASLVQGKKPLLMDAQSSRREPREEIVERKEPERRREPEKRREREVHKERAPHKERARPAAARSYADSEMETYRIEVGRAHGVEPGNIMGAIANEAGLEGKFIGRIVIREEHSFVDLPSGMPKEIFRDLQKVRVAGQKLQISRALKTQAERLRNERRPHKGKAPRR
ncbi:MAG TPA: DEAD/DEAH box helicase [Steroidobacteraceae bacterium]|nr:DEAD/DEAH box helicase [Steroidobacteraceae bacterium]